MIYVLTGKATSAQLDEMLREYGSMVKLAVDTRRLILAGGGVMHADCEQV